MLRPLIRLALLGCLALGTKSAPAFSLIGPNNEPWQVLEIGYNPSPYDPLPTAPKNLGEEYRRNTPVMYYTFDANFWDYFGTNGVTAIERAFEILNDVLNPGVSSYSADLSEFPLAVTRENYRAGALSLLDLKSTTLKLMVEQLGLAAPERYVWNIHNKVVGPGGTPNDVTYWIVKRNWDIMPSPLDQLQASSYVNGVLYSYFILDYFQAPPDIIAEAVEFPVDPLDASFSSVASEFAISFARNMGNNQMFSSGRFYTGLTRDDVGGLRYLIRRQNRNWESPGPTTVSLITNQTPQLLFTSNLTLFASQAVTNSAAAMQALYPGLGVSWSSNFWRTVWVTNLVPYFTNNPYAPVSTNAVQVGFREERSLAIENLFEHRFDNIFAVVRTNGGWFTTPVTNVMAFTNFAISTLQTVNVGTEVSPYAPAGTFILTTNLTSRSFATNVPVGEFFILPTNACEVVLLSPQLAITNYTTNVLFTITNEVAISNATIVTNFITEFTQQIIDSSVTHAFLALPVACVQTNIVLAGGIEKMQFVRRDYDSLIGRFFEPFTNSYSLEIVTNNTVMPMRVFRGVTQPDFLFSAVDAPLIPGPAQDQDTVIFDRNLNFSTNSLEFYPGQAGPGTIEPPTLIRFSKTPTWLNLAPNAYFWDRAEASQFVDLIWSYYDGTTNAPIVFPNGTSIQALEDRYFIQITPGTMPEGSLGVPYTGPEFTISGAEPPYTWTLAPNSPGLPPGLTLAPSGLISGVPTQRATYDFVLRVTDKNGRFVDRPFTIKVNW